jgi:toxin ParE1/3/4
MPNRYIYSKGAESDVSQIYQDTAKKRGIAQADKYDAGLENSMQLLADNPDLGRKSDEIKEGYHRHEYGRHIIFYKKRKHDIFIIRILYDAMDEKRYL